MGTTTSEKQQRKLDELTNGINDLPIIEYDNDHFLVEPYVHAISHFILKCETPITIALQGGWGTGKSSFMNLIINELAPMKQLGKAAYKGSGVNNIVTIQFNTWQFSQFNSMENLGLSFLSYIVKKLSEGAKGQIIEKTKATGMILGKLAMQYLNMNVKDLSPDKFLDEATAIEDLVESIRELVENRLSDGSKTNRKYDRLVVFIDDLDRIKPEVAVGLLEVIKLFLDIENCVFVLAVDNRVIEEGISKLFDSISHEKTKSFLDKMIQVPFRIPVEIYEYQNFLQQFIGNIFLEKSPEAIQVIEPIIKISVGSNPRAMKRLINSFILNFSVILSKNKKIEQLIMVETNQQKKADLAKEIVELTDKDSQLLLSIITLQMAFQPLYVTLYNMQTDTLAKLLNDEIEDVSIQTFLENEIDKYNSLRIFEYIISPTDINNYVTYIAELRKLLISIDDEVQMKQNTEDEDEVEYIISEKLLQRYRELFKLSEITSSIQTNINVQREGITVSYDEYIQNKSNYKVDGISFKSYETNEIIDYPVAKKGLVHVIEQILRNNENHFVTLDDDEKLLDSELGQVFLYPYNIKYNRRQSNGREYDVETIESVDGRYQFSFGNSFEKGQMVNTLAKFIRYIKDDDALSRLYIRVKMKD